MSTHGIIYVIQNELHPANLYKIGYTTKSINERLRELNRETSNPGEFKVYGCYPVSNVKAAEKLCHQTLEQLGYRRKKEFFRGPLDRILAEVEKITGRVDGSLTASRPPQSRTC
ncbi:MAG: GIY-YIG nuclease family protein, partial [bacterium]|nr:GIY-YIG nuclease family protein [bacterium]